MKNMSGAIELSYVRVNSMLDWPLVFYDLDTNGKSSKAQVSRRIY